MGRQKISALTDLELDVMKIVWKYRTATVRQIVDDLGAFRPLAYTTVQTVLTILTQKGLVEHTTCGRAYVYSALVQSHGIRKETVNAVVDRLFEGSRQSLMLHLIDSDSLTPDEASELRQLLDRKIQEAD